MQFDQNQLNGLRMLFSEYSKEADKASSQGAGAGIVIHSERTVVINAQSLNLDAAMLNRLLDKAAS